MNKEITKDRLAAFILTTGIFLFILLCLAVPPIMFITLFFVGGWTMAWSLARVIKISKRGKFLNHYKD